MTISAEAKFISIKKPAFAGYFWHHFNSFKMVPGAGLEPARFVGGGF